MSQLAWCVLAVTENSVAGARIDVGMALVVLAASAVPLLVLGYFGLRWLVRAVLGEELNELRRRLDECFAAVIDLRMQAYELGQRGSSDVLLAQHDAAGDRSEREPPRTCA